jgi:hypothetical protein
MDFLIRETDVQYREKAKDHLTSHQLADFRKCPLLYHRKKLGLIEDEDRPAYLLGRAVHAWVLEGSDAFAERFALGGPINPRTRKPYGPSTQAWADWATAQGKPVLTDEQFELVKAIGVSVGAHEGACRLLAQGVAEGVARAEYCGVPCQARMDWFHPDQGIVDLKTCDDLTWFESDAKRFGYAHQMAFYRAFLARTDGRGHAGAWRQVHIVAVEKKQPFRCGVWVMSEQVLSYCQRENEAAIERLKECEKSGVWPSGYEERRVFDSL